MPVSVATCERSFSALKTSENISSIDDDAEDKSLLRHRDLLHVHSDRVDR